MTVLLGIVLRIAYFLKPRSFWGDEWFTISLSQKPWKELLISSLNDVHPPFQFILYHFGGYRLLPFIAGILSLYFFSKLSKDGLATLLFAISPYFIHLSGETRGYGFLCLFSILALLGYRWAFPCALFTEHYAWFLLLAIPFSFWFLPFLMGSFGLIIHQAQTEQAFLSRFEWSPFASIKKITGLFIQFGGGLKYSFLTLRQAILLIKKPYIVAFILPVVFLFYSRNRKYLKLFLIPILLLLLFYPIRLNARYLPFCGVAYIILITEGFREMRRRHRKIAQAILSCFIIANIFSLGWVFRINHDPYHREDYINASKYIKENFKESHGLIGFTTPIKYYLKRDFPKDGDVLWEVWLGNPEMRINTKLWESQERKLNRRIISTKQFSDLVWVVKYGKEKL